MMSTPDPDLAPTADRCPASPASAGQVWRQLINLRVVGGVFAFCVLIAFSRAVGWYKPEDPSQDWPMMLLRFIRQNLITGFTLLLTIALVEAWLARPRPGPALLWRGLALAGAALCAVLLRHWVGRLDRPEVVLKWTWVFSTTLLWGLIGGAAYALLLSARQERQLRQQLHAHAQSQAQLQAQQLEAQLTALQAQIEPHFLFNTLAHVKRLYETTPQRGRDMLRHLIAYLRAALPSMRRTASTLGQELELVRNYLSILQMRMGERLRFEIEADPALHAAHLPSMVLPTLVENAIKHGLSPLPEGGLIRLQAQAQGETLCVTVQDDGRGFSGDSGTGVGLANTRARLAAMFGPQASLSLEAVQPRGVRVELRLPLRQGTPPPVTGHKP